MTEEQEGKQEEVKKQEEEKTEEVQEEQVQEEQVQQQEDSEQEKDDKKAESKEKARKELKELKEEIEKKKPKKERKEKEPEVPTEERYLTVSLTEANRFKPKYRSRRAIKIIKKQLTQHLKREVKISGKLNQKIWEKSNKPPSKVKVRVEMTPQQAKAYPAKK